MRVQLSTQGVLGNNLVMLAAAKGDMPILKAVMAEISHIKVRSTGAVDSFLEATFSRASLAVIQRVGQ